MIRAELRIIIWLVPIVAYTAIFLLLDVERSVAFWVSICFLSFSYLMLSRSFLAVPRTRVSAILSMPLVLVATIYFGLEFIAATVFIYVPSIPFAAVIVSQIILAAVFLVVFAMTMASNEAIAAQVEEQYADVQVIRSATARLGGLRRNVQHPQIIKAIDRLEEEFRYSPTARTRALHSTDDEIDIQIRQLESLVTRSAGPEAVLGQISAISGALAVRNSEIKLRQ